MHQGTETPIGLSHLSFRPKAIVLFPQVHCLLLTWRKFYYSSERCFHRTWKAKSPRKKAIILCSQLFPFHLWSKIHFLTARYCTLTLQKLWKISGLLLDVHLETRGKIKQPCLGLGHVCCLKIKTNMYHCFIWNFHSWTSMS